MKMSVDNCAEGEPSQNSRLLASGGTQPRRQTPSASPTSDQSFSTSPSLVLHSPKNSNAEWKPAVVFRVSSQPLTLHLPSRTPTPESVSDVTQPQTGITSTQQHLSLSRQPTAARAPDTHSSNSVAFSPEAEDRKPIVESPNPDALFGLRSVVKALSDLTPGNSVDTIGLSDEVQHLTRLGQQYVERHRARIMVLENDVRAATERHARATYELAEARDSAQRSMSLLENVIKDSREELTRAAEQREADRLQFIRDTDAKVESTVAHTKADLVASLSETNARLAKVEYDAEQHVASVVAEAQTKHRKIMAEADAKVKAAWRTVDAKLLYVTTDADQTRKEASEAEERCRELEHRLAQERRRADEAERGRIMAERIATDLEKELRRQELVPSNMGTA